ncbi:MAG: transcription antitermination factor NusB [Betaproteobacteria bacterium]|nr:MAG: transcription antitermination factor NusB [Betaproteobacteria bacterium]
MKGSRRLSRELALQGLYQWLVNQTDADDVLAQIADKEGFAKADQAYLESLVRGVVDQVGALREKIGPHLDRPIEQLSPVEHALLLIAACELGSQPDTPYRVVINEAVELAKLYGGTDGHKYVNGVLDKLAPDLRPEEAATRKSKA